MYVSSKVFVKKFMEEWEREKKLLTTFKMTIESNLPLSNKLVGKDECVCVSVCRVGLWEAELWGK